MNALQINNALCPQAYFGTKHHVRGLRPLPPVSLAFARGPPRRIATSLKLTTSSQKCHRLTPVCLSRGEGRAGSGNQEPLWKSFGNVFENFGKKPSVEDVLRQQIEKGEFYDGGGSGGTPRWGGGGGGDGESEDEGSGILDETIQVILATLGFIFLYMYIINGAEMTKLGRDYLKYLFGGRKSIRLTRAMEQWESFRKRFTNYEVDPFWLEKAIVNTPTWWDSPEKYKRILKSYMQKQPSSDIDEPSADIDE